MSERRKTVFISCGQYAEEERELGKRVCELVKESTAFEGYFAENQTTLKARMVKKLEWIEMAQLGVSSILLKCIR